jgi:cytochrome c oxidase cbb3-type subunit 1
MSELSQVKPDYNYKVVRQFTIMTVVWGIVGMGLGAFIAAQLFAPALNYFCFWWVCAFCYFLLCCSENLTG